MHLFKTVYVKFKFYYSKNSKNQKGQQTTKKEKMDENKFKPTSHAQIK